MEKYRSFASLTTALVRPRLLVEQSCGTDDTDTRSHLRCADQGAGQPGRRRGLRTVSLIRFFLASSYLSLL